MVALCLLTACSDRALVGRNGEPESIALCRDSAGSDYAPPVPGARWTYQTSEDGIRRPDHTTVLEAEPSNGVGRYSFAGEQRGTRWVLDDGSMLGVVRILYVDPDDLAPISDQYFDPPAPRLDYSRMTLGEEWSVPPYSRSVFRISRCPGWQEARGFENLSSCPAEAVVVETIADETWTVTGIDREVTVPAGTFRALCHTRRCTESCRENEVCFATGVGKLTETGDSERDELASVCFPE
jgi:hypothetical protein